MSCCMCKSQRVKPEDSVAKTTANGRGCHWWTPRMASTQEGHYNDGEQSQGGAGHEEVEDSDDDQFEDCPEEERLQADGDQSESDRQNEEQRNGDQLGKNETEIRVHTVQEHQEEDGGSGNWEAKVYDAEQRPGEGSPIEANMQPEEWWETDEFDQNPRKREGRDIEQDLGDQTFRQRAESNATIEEIKSKNHEVVILVASGEKEYKDGIIHSIVNFKKGFGTWREEGVTPARTRILSRDDPPRKIIDTTLLRQAYQRSPTAFARKWISHNSLRRLIVNKYVVGVCVITPSVLEEPCTKDVFGHENCWVDVMRIVFGKHKHGFMFIVKHDGNIDEPTKEKLRYLIRDHDFNPNNIIFSGSDEDVLTVLEDSIGLENLQRGSKGISEFLQKSFTLARSKTRSKSRSGSRCCRKGSERVAGSSNEDDTKSPPPFVVTPFFLEEQSAIKKTFAAWSPERIILFGRAGSGKSTLAQMLTTGKVDPGCARFKIGAGLRGQTKDIERDEGRGWYVVDTPGFGEPRGSQSTISTKEVERTLKKFIDLVQGTFAHYIFVVKKDRVDQLDINLWKFFQLLFGEEMCNQFSIVISNADEEWMAENIEFLRRSFKGCSSFKWAIFPTIHETDGELPEDPEDLRCLIEENEGIARDSLAQLERELASLARCERPCDYGKESRGSRLMEQERGSSDMKLERSLRIKMIAQGSELLCRMEEKFSGLLHYLTINDRIALMPLQL